MTCRKFDDLLPVLGNGAGADHVERARPFHAEGAKSRGQLGRSTYIDQSQRDAFRTADPFRLAPVAPPAWKGRIPEDRQPGEPRCSLGDDLDDLARHFE